jgi:hypothetical protein
MMATDFKSLRPLLDFQGGVPKTYDLESCRRALLEVGLSEPPPSYVKYCENIGFVGWSCYSDVMAILMPNLTFSGIIEWNKRFEKLAPEDEFPLYGPEKYLVLGTIDSGNSICWDMSAGGCELPIVRISRDGEIRPCGRDLFDFIVNYWITGMEKYGKNSKITPDRLSCIVYS